MKGLYVYGALLMALSFTAGALNGSAWLMALAVVSCSLAALSEASHEVNDTYGSVPIAVIGNFIAIASWISTGAAALVSLFVIGGF